VSNGSAVDIIENIGLARFGSSLQVVWAQQDAGNTESLHTRILTAAGMPSSPDIAAATGWGTLNDFPAIFANGSQRIIAFSGIKDTNGNNPYSQGYEYYLASGDGTSWTLSSGALSAASTASSSDGTDAIDAGGTPVAAYAASPATAVSYHSGFIATIPTTPGSDPTTTAAAHCCMYNTGLGYDATSGETWAVWYSNSGDTSTNGVLAQQIQPSLGAQSQAPGNNVHSSGGNDAIPFQYRIATADRVGGGVYAGYLVGYPTATKVGLWKLGSATALTHIAGGSAQVVNATAGTGGRVWLYWWNAATHTIDAVRTNPAATRFGAVCTHPTPNNTEDVWDLVGNDASGDLHLFALAGAAGHAQVYDGAVLPCMSVSVSPAAISSAKGGAFTVTVSDAGAPIKGASVTFASHHKLTSSAGKVTFSVATHHAKGRFPITVSDSGYQTASAKIRVR
jgi:hypothetical protein